MTLRRHGDVPDLHKLYADPGKPSFSPPGHCQTSWPGVPAHLVYTRGIILQLLHLFLIQKKIFDENMFMFCICSICIEDAIFIFVSFIFINCCLLGL